MPHLDYFITTDVELTKDKLRQAEKPLLIPDLILGQDNRTWNKKRLEALKLLLCNIVKWGHRDNGVFLYSRDKKQIPKQFNPYEIGYSSLFWVIEALTQSRLVTSVVAPPRTKGKKAPKKLSEFHTTIQAVNFSKSLGITTDRIREDHRSHIRLRDYKTNQQLPHEWDNYTRHTEVLMAGYCHYLNQHNILESTEGYEEKGFKEWGLRGEPIHLHRNYRNYTDHPDFQKDLYKLWIETNPNFAFGGRSGGYWQGAKTEDRSFILIDGKKTKKADYPCSHINLCYKHLTGRWHQKETFEELKQEGRELEDAYTLLNVHRAIGKKMVTLMLNCKGKSAASRVFNEWINQKNDGKNDNASDEEVVLYEETLKATGIKQDKFNLWLINSMLDKHHRIKDYLFKGKLAGQIIQWAEANLIHHLAVYFQDCCGFPVLTVYDEFIVPEEEQPMIKEFMFTTSTECEICDYYSLMGQIKSL